MTCIRLYSLFLAHTSARTRTLTHTLQLIGILWAPGRGSFTHIWAKEETGQVCVWLVGANVLEYTRNSHTQRRDAHMHSNALKGFFCCACTHLKCIYFVTSELCCWTLNRTICLSVTHLCKWPGAAHKEIMSISFWWLPLVLLTGCAGCSSGSRACCLLIRRLVVWSITLPDKTLNPWFLLMAVPSLCECACISSWWLALCTKGEGTDLCCKVLWRVEKCEKQFVDHLSPPSVTPEAFKQTRRETTLTKLTGEVYVL